MSDKVRIGVIGVGQIGKRHLENYANVRAAEIVAVADLNETEARRVADLHKIPHVYTDFRKLLERDDIQAVDVALHNNLHMPVSCAAMRAGKNVYCEKPMAGAYIDAKTMMDTAAETGRKLSIQLFSLFSMETRLARKLIAADLLGTLYHARSYGYRRRGRPFVDGYASAPFVQKATAAGGALYDMGVYHIAQVLYLLGLPTPKRISGQVYQEMDMDPRRREVSGFDVEELGTGYVKFEGGLTLDIIESWSIHMNPFEGSFIAGSKGGLRLSPLSFHSQCCDAAMDSTFDLKEAKFRWSQLYDTEDAYDSAQHHWVAALQNRVPLEPTAEAALLTMLLSEGVYLSHQLGREVTPEEVEQHSVSTAITL